MKIIVDAYNLLHAVFPGPRASDQQREKLIHFLRSYAKRSGNKILLVFDGGDFSYPYIDQQKNITIAWAGHHMSADDWIMEYLDKNHNQDLLVASSDREIQSYASDHGIVCIGAYSFYKTIERKMQEWAQSSFAKASSYAKASADMSSDRKLHHRGPIKKTTDRTNEIVDSLMREESDFFEAMADKLHDDEQLERIDRGKKVSKKERMLRRQLKKL
jgi:predicted RNA-binding protein with PIN domain